MRLVGFEFRYHSGYTVLPRTPTQSAIRTAVEDYTACPVQATCMLDGFDFQHHKAPFKPACSLSENATANPHPREVPRSRRCNCGGEFESHGGGGTPQLSTAGRRGLDGACIKFCAHKGRIQRIQNAASAAVTTLPTSAYPKSSSTQNGPANTHADECDAFLSLPPFFHFPFFPSLLFFAFARVRRRLHGAQKRSSTSGWRTGRCGGRRGDAVVGRGERRGKGGEGCRGEAECEGEGTRAWPSSAPPTEQEPPLPFRVVASPSSPGPGAPVASTLYLVQFPPSHTLPSPSLRRSDLFYEIVKAYANATRTGPPPPPKAPNAAPCAPSASRVPRIPRVFWIMHEGGWGMRSGRRCLGGARRRDRGGRCGVCSCRHSTPPDGWNGTGRTGVALRTPDWWHAPRAAMSRMGVDDGQHRVLRRDDARRRTAARLRWAGLGTEVGGEKRGGRERVVPSVLRARGMGWSAAWLRASEHAGAVEAGQHAGEGRERALRGRVRPCRTRLYLHGGVFPDVAVLGVETYATRRSRSARAWRAVAAQGLYESWATYAVSAAAASPSLPLRSLLHLPLFFVFVSRFPPSSYYALALVTFFRFLFYL
ncbi:hypothetical protein C8R45DRAFT_1183954 [Mycena sanguinolenta]|nr:hypothetical protein C8R45DRAFT_1183954 [Mycena sanguinolenta]